MYARKNALALGMFALLSFMIVFIDIRYPSIGESKYFIYHFAWGLIGALGFYGIGMSVKTACIALIAHELLNELVIDYFQKLQNYEVNIDQLVAFFVALPAGYYLLKRFDGFSPKTNIKRS